MAGIAHQVLPANSKLALNKFLTEYDWDEYRFNHERLEKLQKHGETRWSKDGYMILDDTINQKAGDEVPGVGHFYDHAEDNKAVYPLTFRLYEKHGDDDQDYDIKYDLALDIVTELEEEAGVRTPTSLTRRLPTILPFSNTSNPTAKTGSACSEAIDR